MNHPIGLGAPLLAFFLFGLIYNPFVVNRLPREGWGEIVTSPQVFFLLAVAVILCARKVSLAHIGLSRKNLSRNLVLGLGLGATPAILTVIIGGILMGADFLVPFLPRPLLGGRPLSAEYSYASIFILVILAPLSEELLFRGVLLRALKEYYSTTFAILFSSLIFMLGHGGFALGPLLLGLITAPIALATGSILPGMIFHAISNCYGPLLVNYFPNLYRYLDVLFQ